MENVKVHVERFDEDTNSLIVYFSGMEGEITFQTASYAFQTHNYNTDNVQDLIKILATIGKSYLEQEKLKQNLSNKEEFIQQLKELGNSEFTVAVSDITPPPPVNNGNIIDDLEVVI